MNDLSIQRVQPHLPAAATWLLGLAIAAQLAIIVLDLIPQPETAPPPVPEALPGPQSGDSQSVDLGGILNAHLFGIAASENPTGDPANAPQTQLSLVLTGTIATEDPAKGIGMVGTAANNTKVYSVGDTVEGAGVKIHAVYADRVVLDRNGALEALYLPRSQPEGVPQSAGAPPPPAAGMAFANRMRDMASQAPDTLTSVMRPQPVFAEGRQRGYRVYPGRNRAQFQRLGLTPGDLILAINGTPLDDPARGMEIFRTMENASQVSVTIERNGPQQNLSLNLAQLAQQAQELANPPANPPQGGPPPVEQADPVPPNPQQD
jgi:general secretion pathway protein C